MPGQDEGSGRDARAAAVAEHFGRLAQGYGAGEYYSRRRAAVAAALRAEIDAARRVLDLGCGNGRYLSEFRKFAKQAQVVGADLSAAMLAEARARNGPQTPLVRADACAAPFRAESFDLIFASHVLPFVADLDAAVLNLTRCLAPGGLLIATAGRGGIGRAVADIVGAPRWAELERAVFPHRRLLSAAIESEERCREAFERAGLTVEIRDAQFTVTWKDVEEWIEVRWMPVLGEENRRVAARLLSEVAELCARRTFALRERLLLGRKG